MTTIKLRRGTAAEWTSANPILAEGEKGIELDTDKEKTGDGITAWTSLPYFGDSGDYLPLTGGTLTGDLSVEGKISGETIHVQQDLGSVNYWFALGVDGAVLEIGVEDGFDGFYLSSYASPGDVETWISTPGPLIFDVGHFDLTSETPIRVRGDMGFGPQRITGLADPIDPTDAVTKAYADSMPGVPGPPGTAYMSAQWTFNQTITPPPVSGGLRFNATTIAATTIVYISETDRDGLDRNVALSLVKVGDQLMVQSAQGRVVFNITSVVDSGTYRTLGVTVAEFSGTRPNASAISTVYSITTGGSGGLQTRATATKTTASLAAGASETGTITLAKSYSLYRITCSAPTRVRMYTTVAKQTADASRAIGTDPTGDHGLIFEFVATASGLAADLSPLVDGFDGKTTPDGVIPITITNTEAGAAAITVTLIWLRTE